MTWTGSALLTERTPYGCMRVEDGVPRRSSLQCFPSRQECEAWALKQGWREWAMVVRVGTDVCGNGGVVL